MVPVPAALDAYKRSRNCGAGGTAVAEVFNVCAGMVGRDERAKICSEDAWGEEMA